jgi:beta-galactosidase
MTSTSLPSFTFDSLCYRIEGKPVYLYSGEMHYFRTPKADWLRRMKLLKEAGGNCVATYIPWLLHEPEEGVFRFGEAADWLDLEGFLKCALKAGLYVIARPGPYQYSELIYDGLPGWLCEQYPEILAQDVEGKPFRLSSISYLHPVFLEKVQRWFEVVCPILAKYTLAQGGPIAFVQLDNETIGIHEWFNSLDYNAETMGFGKEDGRYPTFLKRQFKQVEQMNRAYGQEFASFAMAEPPPVTGQGNLKEIRRSKDYFEFYLETIGEYFQTLAGMIRSYGIEVPLIHNAGNPNMNAYFQKISAEMGDGFLLGSDHYYNLDQNWAQNHPTPQYAARVFLSNEMLRLMGYPPTVLELPGGSAADWPPVTAKDALTAYLTNLALGMKGHNYYVFTGGPNPPGAGSTTDSYDYGAGISAEGEIRPLYRAQKEFGAFIQAHPGLLEASRAYDCRLGFDFDQACFARSWQDLEAGFFSYARASEFLRAGVLTSALCASISPILCDLGADDWLSETSTPLVVVCASSMAAEKQRRLVRFLQEGGKAVFTPLLPVMDEHFEPCTLLADTLQLAVEPASKHSLQRLCVGPVNHIMGRANWIATYPAGMRLLGSDTLSAKPVACHIPLGKGGAVFLGMEWVHAKREHEQMLLFILGELDLKQKVACTNPNLWTSLWQWEGGSLLFILNLLTAPMTARLQFQGLRGWVDAGEHNVPPVRVTCLAYNARDEKV